MSKKDKTKYKKYLQSKKWKDKRNKVLERDRHACRVCNSSNRLNVHHRTYERLGKEYLNDLTTLCEDCHMLFHGVVPLPNTDKRGILKLLDKKPMSVASIATKINKDKSFVSGHLGNYKKEGLVKKCNSYQWCLTDKGANFIR